jgi:hypothetical protein
MWPASEETVAEIPEPAPAASPVAVGGGDTGAPPLDAAADSSTVDPDVASPEEAEGASSRARGVPTPDGYALRFEITDSYLPPQRFHASIRQSAPGLRDCLLEVRRVPRPPPWAWTGEERFDTGGFQSFRSDAEPPFRWCMTQWLSNLSPPDVPEGGASALIIRVRAEAAPRGTDTIRIVDGTDWSTRARNAPRLRLTFEVESSDIPISQVRTLLTGRTAALTACLNREEELAIPPPYVGTAVWGRVNAHPTWTVDFGTRLPRPVARCIHDVVVRRVLYPLNPSDEVHTRFVAEAAGVTTIWVRGAD